MSDEKLLETDVRPYCGTLETDVRPYCVTPCNEMHEDVKKMDGVYVPGTVQNCSCFPHAF